VGFNELVELFEVVLTLDVAVSSCYFFLTKSKEKTKSQGWIILPWTFDQRNRPPPKLASLRQWVAVAIPFDQVLRVGLLGRGGFGLNGFMELKRSRVFIVNYWSTAAYEN